MVNENDSEGIEEILENFREGDRIYERTRFSYENSEEDELSYQKARTLIERALDLEEIAKQVFFNCPINLQTSNEIILLDTVINTHLRLGEEYTRINDFKTANTHFNSISQMGEIVLEYYKQETDKSFNIKTIQFTDKIKDLEEEFGEMSREVIDFMTEGRWVIEFPTRVKKAMYQGYQLAAYAAARTGNILEAANQTVKAIKFVQGKNNLGFMPEEFIPPNIRTDSYRRDNLGKGIIKGLYSQEKTYQDGMLASPGLFDDHEKWLENNKLNDRNKFESQISNRREYIDNLTLKTMYQFLKTESKQESLNLMFEAIATDPTLVKSYVILMEMYSSIGDEEKKSEILEAIVTLISGKSSIGDYDAGNPNPDYSEVWQLEDFISKADDEQNARKQHGLMNYLRDSSEDKGKYPESYGYREGLDGKVYLVTVVAGRTPLSSVAKSVRDRKSLLGLVQRSLDALVDFRYVAKSNKDKLPEYDVKLEEFDYAGYFDGEIARHLKLEPEVYQKGKAIAQKLQGKKRVFSHGDFHLGNLVETKEGVTIIDLAKANYSSELYDVVNLLELDQLNLDEEEKIQLFGYFVGKMQERGISMEYSDYQDYKEEAAFMNLNFAKRSSNPKAFYYNPERQKRHYQKAKEIIDSL